MEMIWSNRKLNRSDVLLVMRWYFRMGLICIQASVNFACTSTSMRSSDKLPSSIWMCLPIIYLAHQTAHVAWLQPVVLSYLCDLLYQQSDFLFWSMTISD